jgi:hypothetical protein
VKRNGSQKRKQKRDGSKKDGGNETEKAKEDSAAEPKTYFEEEKKVTLEEYEKVCEEKKKSLEVTATVVRTISAEEFKGLQLLEKKKAEEEAAIKKVKPKEKMQLTTEGGAGKKPDAKMVFTILFDVFSFFICPLLIPILLLGCQYSVQACSPPKASSYWPRLQQRLPGF